MATTSSGGEPAHATADREIVISGVIGAPRERVFEAFTRVRHLSRWWGPEGFTTTTRSLRSIIPASVAIPCVLPVLFARYFRPLFSCGAMLAEAKVP